MRPTSPRCRRSTRRRCSSARLAATGCCSRPAHPTRPTASPRPTSCASSCSACCARWWRDRPARARAEHSTSSAAVRRRPPSRATTLDWQDLPALRVDDARPAGRLAAHASASTSPPQRLERARARRPSRPSRCSWPRPRAALEAGDLDRADAAARQLLADDPWEWRAVWLSGLVALARGDGRGAQSAFNAVYGQVPGELAPKLALALACETGGETDVAESLYVVCARTDANYIAPAAFGLARIRSGRGDVDGAVARARPRARDQPGVHPGRAAGAPGCWPSRAAACRRSPPRWTASTASPSTRVDRARLRVRRAGSRPGHVVRRTGPRPDGRRSAGRPAAEPDAARRAGGGLPRARRRSPPTRERAGRAGRPRERGPPLDAAMTDATSRPSAGAVAAADLLGAPVGAPASGSARPAAPSSRPRRSAGSRRRRSRPRRPTATVDRDAAPDAAVVPRAAPPRVPRVRRRGRRRRLLHAVRRARRRSQRDHFAEQPAPGWPRSCDRGVRHPATRTPSRWPPTAEPGSHAVLVVCDGVSTSADSDVASLAAARAARDVLAALDLARHRDRGRPGRRRPRSALEAARRTPPTTPSSRAPHRRRRPGEPRRRARSSPRSSTGLLVVAGWVGDSRAYWLPDDGEPRAAHRRRLVGRRADRRRRRPRGGRDAARRRTPSRAGSASTRPTTCRARPRSTLDGAGLGAGVLRRPVELLLRGRRPRGARARPARRPRPPSRSTLADALVDWANAQGGHDNITVALARARRRTEPPHRPRSTPDPQREGDPRWPTFTAEVFQNEFLPDGGTDVHAIVTVTCTGAGEAGQDRRRATPAEIIIVDTSGSMGGDKIRAAQQAAAAALDQMPTASGSPSSPGTTRRGSRYPVRRRRAAMVRMDARHGRPPRPRSAASGRRRHGDRHLAAAGHRALRRPSRGWRSGTRSC